MKITYNCYISQSSLHRYTTMNSFRYGSCLFSVFVPGIALTHREEVKFLRSDVDCFRFSAVYTNQFLEQYYVSYSYFNLIYYPCSILLPNGESVCKRRLWFFSLTNFKVYRCVKLPVLNKQPAHRNWRQIKNNTWQLGYFNTYLFIYIMYFIYIYIYLYIYFIYL